MKALIGVTGSILSNENEGVFSGYERAYVNDDYIDSVVKAHAVPIILPIVDDENIIKEQVSMVDSVIISGGYDIDPIYWGEEVSQKLGRIFPRRDEYELKIIKHALEMKKPILGICRGLQVLNVAFGGSLYQDLSLIPDCYIKHSQNAKPYETTHGFTTKEGSIIRKIVGEKIRVNSYHHLAIKELGKGLKATGFSPDGIIESIEYTEEGKFVLGVQFHPEMLHNHESFAMKIFEYFVETTVNKKK